MIANKSKHLCLLLSVLVVISTSFADAYLRGVDDEANQQSPQSWSGAIEEIHNGQRAKARGKPRNRAQRHALQNIRAMNGIGRVSNDVRNRDLSPQSRIVGGTAASNGEYKFFASWDVGCGGSLIAPNMILTAAHCADQDNGSVRIGSNLYNSGGVTRRVTRQCRHPKYDDSSDAYDYMILTLDNPVDTAKFPVIKLNNNKSLPKTDAMLTVIGFGAIKEGGSQSNTLLKVDVPANSHQVCRKQYSWVVEEVHLCAGFTAGGKDSCQGDSGGPIFEMINGVPVQVGVVSTGDGCARPNKSGVYSRLSGGYDWIQQTMKKINSGDLSGCNGGSGFDVPAPTPIDDRPAPTVDSPTAASPTGESPTAASPTAESPTAESPTAESPTAESPTAESPTAESPTAESPTFESPTAESPTAESPTFESPTVESPTAESPTIESPTIDSPTTPTEDDDSTANDDNNNGDDGTDDDGLVDDNNNDDDNNDDDNWWQRRVLGRTFGL